MTAAIELVINFPTCAPSVQVDFGGKNGTVDTQNIFGNDRHAATHSTRGGVGAGEA